MIGIIDYGASNLQSVCNALHKMNQSFEIVASPEQLSQFQKVILPGVGAAGQAILNLRKIGFDRVLPQLKVPFLGICLGMQILADFSEEGQTKCLSILPGRVNRLPEHIKTPEIGWNQVQISKPSPLLEGVPDASYFYFVNSYYFEPSPELVYGKTLYGVLFASIVQKENFYGVQFHPEKSGEAGFQILRNFCEKC